MADSLSPVAIRVARPYATEGELLENELETLTRTSITLLGAQPRPVGLVLRFELVLSSGQVLIRGEGRVVGHKPDAHYGTGGLTLRFTRLDSKSKALVDRAALMRERLRPSAIPSSTESLPTFDSLQDVDGEDPAPSSGFPAELADANQEPPTTPASVRPSPAALAGARPAVLEPFPAGPAPAPRPRDRDALLDRLRARAKASGETPVKLLDHRDE